VAEKEVVGLEVEAEETVVAVEEETGVVGMGPQRHTVIRRHSSGRPC
jgi:hypothetical protein